MLTYAIEDSERPKNEYSVLSRFRFLGEQLRFLEDPPAEILFAMYLFMRSTVYFQVGATHPAHPVDKSLDIRERSSNNYMNYCILRQYLFIPCLQERIKQSLIKW
jgi:hypothetical protein